jgi:N-acetylmuramoyl-L-alanine amidase
MTRNEPQIPAFMARLKLFGVLLVLACLSEARASVRAQERVWIRGVEYENLEAWAARHQYEVHWSRAGSGVELTRGRSRLTFEKDSNFGSVNGVNIFLSWAVAVRNAIAYVAVLDEAKVLEPLLFPSGATRTHIERICLDPGHGGKDPGTQAAGIQEKKQTLLLAQEVARQLRELGYKIVITRTRDKYIGRPQRWEDANRSHSQLFVSLHFNASEDKGVSGVETYCLTPPGANSSNSAGESANVAPLPGNAFDGQNIALAYRVQRALVRELGVTDRGVHRARFEVLCPLAMPGVLVESGFLSNPSDAQRIVDPLRRKIIARAIVDGVVGYCRSEESTVPNFSNEKRP